MLSRTENGHSFWRESIKGGLKSSLQQSLYVVLRTLFFLLNLGKVLSCLSRQI